MCFHIKKVSIQKKCCDNKLFSAWNNTFIQFSSDQYKIGCCADINFCTIISLWCMNLFFKSLMFTKCIQWCEKVFAPAPPSLTGFFCFSF